MSVNNNFRLTAYGEKNPSQFLAKIPLVVKRDPKTSDLAPIGQLWINPLTDAYWVLTSFSAGSATWTAQSTGSSTQASLDITGTSGDVLTVAAGGDTVLGGDLSVTGNTDMTGDLTVTGDFVANGDFDITDAQAISLTSTANVPQALYFHANGGTSETIEVRSDQGTGLTSLNLLSDVGGIKATAGLADVAAINLVAGSGGVKIDSVLTSSINVVGAGADIQLNATGGSIAATATESVAGAVTIAASGALGTVALAGTGGISIAATNNGITVASGTGTVGISSDATANTLNLGNGAGAKTVVVGSTNTTSSTTMVSGSGGVTITGTNATVAIASGTGAMNIAADAAAGNVNFGTGAAAKVVKLGSTTAGSTTALQTPTGTLVVAANGISVTTAGTGVSLPGGLLVLAGAGSPNTVVTAPIGSLFLRSDPAGATSRLYVNTDASTAWVNVTCAG